MFIRRKNINFFYTVLLGAFGLMGCEPQSASLPPLEGLDLPPALSASYEASFFERPEITAHHFLTAYDRFAEAGPVTRANVLDYSRMQEALERGRLLGHILALDMNGDGNITRPEFQVYSALPQGANKRLRLEDIFLSDENEDEVISLAEAILYSRELYARATAYEMRPIESYLMLFDVNGDGTVTRPEMKRHLFDLFPIREAEKPRKTAGLRRAYSQ